MKQNDSYPCKDRHRAWDVLSASILLCQFNILSEYFVMFCMVVHGQNNWTWEKWVFELSFILNFSRRFFHLKITSPDENSRKDYLELLWRWFWRTSKTKIFRDLTYLNFQKEKSTYYKKSESITFSNRQSEMCCKLRRILS